MFRIFSLITFLVFGFACGQAPEKPVSPSSISSVQFTKLDAIDWDKVIVHHKDSDSKDDFVQSSFDYKDSLVLYLFAGEYQIKLTYLDSDGNVLASTDNCGEPIKSYSIQSPSETIRVKVCGDKIPDIDLDKVNVTIEPDFVNGGSNYSNNVSFGSGLYLQTNRHNHVLVRGSLIFSESNNSSSHELHCKAVASFYLGKGRIERFSSSKLSLSKSNFDADFTIETDIDMDDISDPKVSLSIVCE